MGTKNTAFSSFNIDGPYRATKLWNEVVRVFRSELPRGYHRKKMKTFDDCFVASDAVDWLWEYLRQSHNFGPHVCREQATQLLLKFLHCNLIEGINVKRKDGKPVFEDNKDLYRVKKSTPLKSPAPNCLKKIMRSPLAELPPVQNCNSASKDGRKPVPKVDCSSAKLETRNMDDAQSQVEQKSLSSRLGASRKPTLLSPQEDACIWKSVLWNKLAAAVSIKSLENILNPEDVHGATIIHNVTNLQRNGIVNLTDKSDDIPNWILCAMKCLAKWPNASGSSSCLPNYPGFEKDVFKVVKEYFLGLPETLIPAQFFGIISALYEMVTSSQKSSEIDSTSLNSGRISSTSSTTLPRSISSNLPLKEISKAKEFTFSDTRSNARPEHVRIKPALSSDAILELSKQRMSYCFETAFTEECPATRIIPKPNMKAPKSTGFTNPAFSDDANDYHNVTPPDYFKTLERRMRRPVQRVAPLRSDSIRCLSLDHLAGQTRRFQFERREKKRIGLHQVYYGKPFDPNADTGHKMRTASCDNLSVGSSVLSADSDQMNMVIRNPYTSISDQERGRVRSLLKPDDAVRKLASNLERGHRVEEKVGGLSSLERSNQSHGDPIRPLSIPRSHKLVKCFQLVLLLIPIAKRRKLHLLLRFLNKVKINRSLDLFPDEYAQAMIVKMFWKCVLKTPGVHVEEEEEAVVFEVVEFLLDHCEAILAPPIELKIEVDNILTLLNQARMRQPENEWNPEDFDCPMTFCEQVTSQMYEEQKVHVLRSSLKELLEEILSNPALSEKDKTRKLDKFRKQYPEVYSERFPKDEHKKMKRKRSLLRKLKDMRL